MHRNAVSFALSLGSALLLAAAVFPADSQAAATITVVNLDGASEGFNDASAADPDSTAGGNTGATLGAQRLQAFEFAANIWGGILDSSVEIRVGANFDPLLCDATSAVLGSAGPDGAFVNFTGALVANTIYPVALANKLGGVDYDPESDDIRATFNSSIGTICLFPRVWYYGLDGNPPANRIDFVTVVLHELAHGLGFVTFVDLATGAKLADYDDTYMLNLEDHSTGEMYPDMTPAERVTASTDTGDLHWVGLNVIADGAGLTAGRDGVSGHVEMYAPDPQQLGSSVSHFSTALNPNELMEPFYTAVEHDPGLALGLLLDIGWSTCGNGVPDAPEECDDGNTNPGDCCSPTCQYESAATVCRAGSGDLCDPDETCTGTSGTCPADVVSPATTVCNPGSGDLCDPDESCTGTAGEACPADSIAPATTLCRAGSGDVCDPDETCTGVADAACPADIVSPATTICDPGSGDLCDPDESCTGTAGEACPADSIAPATTLCRAGSGDLCDPDESCTGVADAACPADVVSPATTICDPGSGDLCDPDESCIGTAGEACPVDFIAPATTLCRAGSGDLCDPDESCTGVADATCPADVVSPTTTICNPGSGDLCDPYESCTGTAGEACPADSIAPATTLCRAGSGDVCDPDETCTGVADATCPADQITSPTTICRAGSGEPYDPDESCTGIAGEACPPDQATTPIPAVSGWGQALLALLVTGAGAVLLRRRWRPTV